MRLAIKAVAAEQGLPEDEVASRLEQLRVLLPDLGPSALQTKPADLARLAVQAEAVAEKLVALKLQFPTLNVSAVAAGAPWLLQRPLGRLQQDAKQARLLLGPDAEGAESLLEAMPMLVDPAVLEEVGREVQRLFGCKDWAAAVALLRRNPSLALSCQTLNHQSRGDRDAPLL